MGAVVGVIVEHVVAGGFAVAGGGGGCGDGDFGAVVIEGKSGGGYLIL